MSTSTSSTPAAAQPPSDESESLAFRRWANFILRFRWPLLALTVGSTLAMTLLSSRMKIDPTTDGMIGRDSEEVRTLELLRDRFGDDLNYQVLVTGDVFTRPYIERLRALHKELADLNVDVELPMKTTSAAPAKSSDEVGFEGDTASAAPEEDAQGSIVEEIISLINARDMQWKDGGLVVGKLLEQTPADSELPALRSKVLHDRTLVGQLVGRTGKHSVIVVRTPELEQADAAKVLDAITALAHKHGKDGFKVEVTGSAATQTAMVRLQIEESARLFIASALVMLLVLSLLFRSLLGVLGPIMVVIQSVLWTLGAMTLTNVPMTPVTNILPAFLICVGIADAIHIQSVYRDERREGLDNRAAIVKALAISGKPVFYTSLTEVIGMLSFCSATMGSIKQLGIFGAFGVSVAFIQSVVFLPIMLSFHRKGTMGSRAPQQGKDRLDALLAFCSKASAGIKRARRVAVLGAVATVLAIPGISRLERSLNFLKWMPDDLPVRVATENLDANVGGAAALSLLVQAPPGGTLRDGKLLNALDKLDRDIERHAGPGSASALVDNITSPVDVVRESWRVMNGGSDKFYAMPDTERGVTDMLTMVELSNPETLHRLITADAQSALMVVRTKWRDAWAYVDLLDHIERAAKQLVGPLASVKITGSAVTGNVVFRALVEDLVSTFSTSLLLVTAVMVFMFKNLKLGLLAMIPNVIPILIVGGLMGFFGVPLDVNTMLIASIAQGIIVDDTMHFLHRFTAHMKQSGDVELAIQDAYHEVGRAKVVASAILAGGFGVFVAAQMNHLKLFGLLLALTIGVGLFVDLLLLPAVLRLAYPKRARAPEPQWNMSASSTK